MADKYGVLRIAVCSHHADRALAYFAANRVPAEVRAVTGQDGYKCSCGYLADWYLLEVFASD